MQKTNAALFQHRQITNTVCSTLENYADGFLLTGNKAMSDKLLCMSDTLAGSLNKLEEAINADIHSAVNNADQATTNMVLTALATSLGKRPE